MQTGLYKYQAKVRGALVTSVLIKEAFTTSFEGTIVDVDLGTVRDLTLGEYYILAIDPKNAKKQGIEFILARPTSVTDGVYTFEDVFRGLDLDEADITGSFERAKEWTSGTRFGIVTEHINMNYLKGLIDGTEVFRNQLTFAEDSQYLKKVTFGYSPAFLTCGAAPTTTLNTWTGVTDGEFAVTINGVAQEITGINFNNLGSLEQVAKTIQDAIRTVTGSLESVTWDGTQFTISSSDTTDSSAITVLSTVAVPSGTDISGAGAENYLDGDTGNGTITPRNKGLLRSSNVADIAERDALTNVQDGDEVYVVATGLKYDRLGGTWVDRATGGIGFATESSAGTVELATLPEQGNQDSTGGSGAELVVQSKNTVKVPSVYIPAFLTGGSNAESDFNVWAAITDGEFKITIDGTPYNISGIDFTGDASMNDVAATIQAAIQAATTSTETVVWDTDHFVITSADTTATSAITVTETVDVPAGTDISGAGASDWMDSDSGNGVVTNATPDASVLENRAVLIDSNGKINVLLLPSSPVPISNEASADNSTIFQNTDDNNRLAFKNSSGTVFRLIDLDYFNDNTNVEIGNGSWSPGALGQQFIINHSLGRVPRYISVEWGLQDGDGGGNATNTCVSRHDGTITQGTGLNTPFNGNTFVQPSGSIIGSTDNSQSAGSQGWAAAVVTFTDTQIIFEVNSFASFTGTVGFSYFIN